MINSVHMVKEGEKYMELKKILVGIDGLKAKGNLDIDIKNINYQKNFLYLLSIVGSILNILNFTITHRWKLYIP